MKRRGTNQIQDHIRDEATLQKPKKGTAGQEARSTAQPELGGGNDAPETHDRRNL
jgi:hypothetical protein